MTVPQYMTEAVSDWEVTSYGDVSLLAGIGMGVWHFKFRSGRLGKHVNCFFVAGGVGAAAEVEGRLQGLIAAFNRGRGAGTAESGYSRIRTLIPFSMTDIHGGFGALASASVAAGVGSALSMLTLTSSGIGSLRGRHDLFRMHEMTGTTLGAGAGASIVWGTMVGIEPLFRQLQLRSPYPRRFERERRRRPTDPVIRPAGGF